MDKTIKAQWVAALRSGDYEQGQGELNNQGMFCCLGVLCDLAVKAEIVTATSHTMASAYVPGQTFHYTVYGDDSTGVLPPEVMAWAGIDSEAGKLPVFIETPGYAPTQFLTELNDDQLKTFDQIADIIEEHL